MAKILNDRNKTTLRTRNIIWAVGAMHRGTYRDKAMAQTEWLVEEPQWLVAAETAREAIREIAKANAADLARACWDDRSQRCLMIMPWYNYTTERVAPGADIDEMDIGEGFTLDSFRGAVPTTNQIVRYHRRWS